jgi:hypothetical protein
MEFYITIDRDFMKGSFTAWDDGNVELADGRRAVGDLLKRLREINIQKFRLIGMDVTGLPELNGASKYYPSLNYIAESEEDIRTFYGYFREYMYSPVPIRRSLPQIPIKNQNGAKK